VSVEIHEAQRARRKNREDGSSIIKTNYEILTTLTI
jgi:hypothetical protein